MQGLLFLDIITFGLGNGQLSFNIWFLCCFMSGITEANQELIMEQGGISLLSETAADAEDPQTLRMVAGAIANLCGNGMLHFRVSVFLFFRV